MLMVALIVLEKNPTKPPIEDYIDFYKSVGSYLTSSSPETLEAMNGISLYKSMTSVCCNSADLTFAERVKSR